MNWIHDALGQSFRLLRIRSRSQTGFSASHVRKNSCTTLPRIDGFSGGNNKGHADKKHRNNNSTIHSRSRLPQRCTLKVIWRIDTVPARSLFSPPAGALLRRFRRSSRRPTVGSATTRRTSSCAPWNSSRFHSLLISAFLSLSFSYIRASYGRICPLLISRYCILYKKYAVLL